MSEISEVTYDLLEKLLCFTDVDLTSTLTTHFVRNFEYKTDLKMLVGTGMIQRYCVIINLRKMFSLRVSNNYCFYQEKFLSSHIIPKMNVGIIIQIKNQFCNCSEKSTVEH